MAKEIVVTGVATARMKVDTGNTTVIPVNKPRGTVFWGGAGLDGVYLKPLLHAFTNAGIHYLWAGVGNTSSNNFGDEIGTLIDAARTGLMIKDDDETNDWRVYPPTFTQAAKSYVNLGYVVDHLVLIGSPIDADFLALLKSHKNIKKLTVIDLTQYGDPIYAGMSLYELALNAFLLKKQMDNNKGEGHYYYAHGIPDAPRRWAELAKRIKNEGLE